MELSLSEQSQDGCLWNLAPRRTGRGAASLGQARKILAAGNDPSAEKRKERAAAIGSAANTFKIIAEEWGKKQEREGLAEITLLALRMTPHVFARPGELRQAEWDEFDIEKSVWSIPAEKMKMRRPHRVPSKQVMAILEELDGLTGDGKYLFPSFRSRWRPMSENSINAALRRLGYSQGQMTAHGFPAMAATLLNEMGTWSVDAIERQLAHQEGGVRRACARGEYWDERVKMMQHWVRSLDVLREGAKIVTGRFPKRESST